MIFIEQKRAKLRLSEHPATHTSPTDLKSYFDTLAFKINAKSHQNQKGRSLWRVKPILSPVVLNYS
jgi:hypothetical protein